MSKKEQAESTQVRFKKFASACPRCNTTAPRKFIKSYLRATAGFANVWRVGLFECDNCGKQYPETLPEDFNALDAKE